MKIPLKFLSTLLFLAIIATTLSCENKPSKEGDSDDVDFLLVQNADGMTLSDGELRLKNVVPTTLYFSDRPDRIVGRVTTQEYVDHWAVGDNNFKADPPNAVISMVSGTEVEDITVVLTEPKLEGADLVYNVEVLDGSTNIVGGEVALFIDVIGRPLTPLLFFKEEPVPSLIGYGFIENEVGVVISQIKTTTFIPLSGIV